jgi:hypothetical protein
MAVPDQRNYRCLGRGPENKFGRSSRGGGFAAVPQTVDDRKKDPAGKALDDMAIP